ncbi:MAG: peptide-binding protein, partial [Thermoplasmata archaeon]|nr:peptide-binding protein [Thermoplasmata archaeon]NIS14492.1 peptide-binding protein [Thermoplasmata archaeon]
LRKGVKFHDGVEFTADDVVFTYEAYTDPSTPTPYGSIFGPVESVEAVDPYTVRVTYSEPFAPALESWGVGMMPRHLLEGENIGESKYNRAP